MSAAFTALLAAQRNRVDTQLALLNGGFTAKLTHALPALAELSAACGYVLAAGGKRIRPSLVYLTAEAVGGKGCSATLDLPACAMEIMHTYSLVHDDLPAMDDDELRRGQPSCHIAYNEAVAILVGDGLQARAFELLAGAPGLDAEQRVAMISTLAAAAGPQGMVGGQAIDIAATNTDISLQHLSTMHLLKTAALIRAALALGGIAAHASDQQLQALDEYGTHIGLAFQVVDDILDVAGETATLGKTQGKDSASNKPTYITLLGLAGAKAEAQRLLDAATTALEVLGPPADNLRALARYIVDRDR